MGDVIALAEWRAARPGRTIDRGAVFYFDLANPLSYLTAERVERVLGAVEWQPVIGVGPDGPGGEPEPAERIVAERVALAHRLPLIWPDWAGTPAPTAMRAAQYAAEVGAGCAFALAVGRLAYCGGFPLEHPGTIAEAAAAAGLELGAVLGAAEDEWRDVGLRATGRGLRRARVGALPAIRFGGVLLHGPDALERAAWLHQGRLPNRAPAG